MIKAVQPHCGILFMQAYKFPRQFLIALFAAADAAVKPCIIAASGDFENTAEPCHRNSLALGLDKPVNFFYGFDRMPTDFFKTSMTSFFSAICLRRARTSASNSFARWASRF